MGMSRTALLAASVAAALLLAAFCGCSQASSPVEKREKKEGVEQTASKPQSKEEKK